jgi:hypothetical protein
MDFLARHFALNSPLENVCVAQKEKGSFLILGINPSDTVEYIKANKLKWTGATYHWINSPLADRDGIFVR